ncbi:hypothetical protein GCM10012280_37640 [Wenjunlia tyrosinilytica]|uniref:Uncharacterized protein n=1 Tax=Wenjunlia tyrosinilytica TaxID=1544741 RepID=A0A918DYI5_9ACTN|nr:hypothetical protein GCM10012280_37640 [Wenjunlia tyrosinilytica]
MALRGTCRHTYPIWAPGLPIMADRAPEGGFRTTRGAARTRPVAQSTRHEWCSRVSNACLDGGTDIRGKRVHPHRVRRAPGSFDPNDLYTFRIRMIA